MNKPSFRRPASLDPFAAEEMVGLADPARRVHLAHETAHALVGGRSKSAWASSSADIRSARGTAAGGDAADGGSEAPADGDTTSVALEVALSDPATLQRVVREEGMDAVAGLWSDSPSDTLPGALWRLYLLQDVIRRDPVAVAARCQAGVQQVPQLGAEAGLSPDVDVAELVRVIDAMTSRLMAARVTDVLNQGAALCRVLATGSAMDADLLDVVAEQGGDEQPLTSAARLVRGARALLVTADELSSAARLWADDKLD